MKNLLRILGALAVLAAILQAPQAALQAAQTALTSWWQAVLPALLPFFILTEFLSHTGLIRALSIWLEPVMQPLFRLPGAAALAVVLGFFAGSPTGGAIACQLRRQGLVSRNEGERLTAFCNNAGPLYVMLTVTAVLQQPAVGLWLALVHYPLNLLWGLLLRFRAEKTPAPAQNSARQLLRQGWQAVKQTPAQPFSVILRQSALQALTNIGMIGAFMLVFSLLLLTLRQTGLLQILQLMLLPLTRLFGLPESVLPALAEGFFEMTLGVNRLAESGAPLFSQLLAAAIILSWSGLSIHAQIAGVISESDLSLKYYLPCRLLHSLAAPALLLALRPWFNIDSATLPAGWAQYLPNWLLLPGALLLPGLLLLLTLSLLALLLTACRPRGKY